MRADAGEEVEPILHTNIDREGCIVELRPEGQDFVDEGDMTHLSREAAEELRDTLDDYLNDDGRERPDIEVQEAGMSLDG